VLPTQLAVLLAVAGIGNIVVQGFLVGRLVPRFGEQALISILIFVVPAFWMQYPIIVLSTAFNGLLWPTLGALITNRVPQHVQGSVSGVTTALGSLTSIIGPLWAGVLYDGVSHTSPFWTGATIFVAAWLLTTRVRQPAAALEPILETN